MGKITAIHTAVPFFKSNQLDIFEAIKSIHSSTKEEERMLKFLYKNSSIDTRYSALPDFSITNKPLLYTNNDFINVEQRMEIYNKEAFNLASDVVNKCIAAGLDLNSLTHVITISCTGMCAPGLDLMLVEAFQMKKNIKRTSVNFMGCYAAMHGLKIANDIVKANQNAKVILVDVELCTLHFQQDKTIDNIVSTILFGDGAAAFLVEHHSTTTNGWMIHDFYSEIVLEGKKEMSWDISSKGFLMTLTNEVPKLIEKNIQACTDSALKQFNILQQDIQFWCIHPGGKTIIEAMQKGLNLSKADCKYSYEILKNYGNMSSTTIMFVLDLIAKNMDIQQNTKTMMCAFGPGLTLETAYIEYV